MNQTQLKSDIEAIKCDDIYGSLESQVKAVKTWEKIFKIYDREKENMNKK